MSQSYVIKVAASFPGRSESNCYSMEMSRVGRTLSLSLTA